MINNTYETLYNKIIYIDYKYEYEKYPNIKFNNEPDEQDNLDELV